jgi:sialic acid synthase SpsE
LKIGSIDLDREVLVIAEIGNNHEGQFDLACEMIGLAAEAGAGAVKFQTIVPDRLVSVAQKERIQQLERFRFTYDQFRALSLVAEREGVLFLSTPFDLESARFLNDLVPAFKIASGDNNFFPLIDVVARTGKPILLSAGLADLDDLKVSVERIRAAWRSAGVHGDLAVLHCVVSYPTPPADAHLRAILALRELGVTVGYSDHTLGIEAAVLAVALGARVIEKHFTINKQQSSFRDHQLSADPAEMKELVRRVRDADVLLGSPGKHVTASERDVLEKVRRSIVAARDLGEGHVVAPEDLGWVRPGHGLAPGQEHRLVGRRLRRAISRGDAILAADVGE